MKTSCNANSLLEFSQRLGSPNCRVLVTGGAGFIGSHVVDSLVDAGLKAIIVDNLATGKLDNINSKAILYPIDICSAELKRVFEIEEPEYVIHLAAQVNVIASNDNPLYDANVNVLGSINLLECCRKYSVKKVVYSSSAAVYGEPITLPLEEDHLDKAMSYYAVSKHAVEQYVRTFSVLSNIPHTILRYANVYGPRQDTSGESGVVSIFASRMLQGLKPIVYGSGQQTRDFVFVKDVVHATLLALTTGDGMTLNVSSGTATSLVHLMFLLCKITGKNILPLFEQARFGDIVQSYLSNKKAQQILSWAPRYSLEQGLIETVEYLRSEDHNSNRLGT